MFEGKRDYDAVKREIAAAGYKGEKVAYLTPTDFPILKAEGDVCADMLKRAGFNVDDQAMDAATMFQRRGNRGDLEHGGWSCFPSAVAGIDADRVVLYTPTEARSARAMAKLTWSQRIQDALDRDRFVLHLQPILELATNEVSHGELLLRMQGGRGKLIAPGAFLPAAERFGLIHSIDRWVIQQAISLIAGAGPDQLGQLSINLSGESVVGDAQLLSLIEQALSEADVDPSRLIFEITETAAIANMTEATRFARGLTDLGCSLALDDFGTDFGSFYYLKHLPVRYVKMDGEFIQNLPRSEVDEHMVKAIVGVAQGLGIKTVAESVADDETIRLLQDHGVDYAQGFHVGRPSPVRAGRR